MAGTTYTVERRAVIDAPPDEVREWIVDFRRWPMWSPWEDLDPDVVHEYGGSDSGIGSWTTWKGNRKAGQGRMEITAADDVSVSIDLQFLKPFRSNPTTDFRLGPRDGATEVTWTMTGPKPLMMKVFGIFWSMEKMIGKDFDKGLERLKARVEGGSARAGSETA